MRKVNKIFFAGKAVSLVTFFYRRMKKRRHSRRRRRTYFAALIVTLAAAGCLSLILSFAARSYALRRLGAIEEQYRFDIRYHSASLQSFNKIRIEGLTIAPRNAPARLYAQSFVVKANLWSASFSKEEIEGFEIEQLRILSASRTQAAAGSPGYDALVGEAFEQLSSLFALLPSQVSARDVYMACPDGNGREQVYYIPRLTIAGTRFVAEMQNPGDDGPAARWICRGTYRDQPAAISLRMYAPRGRKAILPFVGEYAGATASFDTLAVDLRAAHDRGGLLTLRGRVASRGLTLYHPSLSSDTLELGRVYAAYRVVVGRNFIEVDSAATSVRYKRLELKPFVRLEQNGRKRLRMALDKGDFPASDVFASLPRGAFGHLQGLQASGTLSAHFLLDVDMARVQDLAFEAEVRSRNLGVAKYGATDLGRMSGPFTHRIRDAEGRSVRSFEVGPRNPDFCPLDAVSRYLAPAILHAEDFAFYRHRGFYPEAFRKSLVENIEAGRFLRGASTLTMQVVKNVFLRPDKTLARKMEEILIVWLVENDRLTSKDRMLEVYMNVIEWGPNVYGITEASRFYFAKDPSALTLGECIFLAYIIPYPRYIRDHFNGFRPKPAYYEFFRDALRRLQQRGYITPSDAASAHAELVFRGPAADYLAR
jgi:hypothetical protein